MGRWLAIDFGTKRTGIAVTDPLRIIAQPLNTYPTDQVLDFLTTYCQAEDVDRIVIGAPVNWDGSATHATQPAEEFRHKLAKKLPQITIVTVDERNSSKEAARVLVQSGIKKKKRQEKGMLDKVSAAILLQQYMETHTE